MPFGPEAKRKAASPGGASCEAVSHPKRPGLFPHVPRADQSTRSYACLTRSLRLNDPACATKRSADDFSARPVPTILSRNQKGMNFRVVDSAGVPATILACYPQSGSRIVLGFIQHHACSPSAPPESFSIRRRCPRPAVSAIWVPLRIDLSIS